jgi:GNAT superfamily N-acetyltransferase
VLPRLTRLLADPAAFLYVASADGSVVGFASGYAIPLIQREPTARLMALVVADGARGSGVGRALVEVTSAAHRAEAHAFYEHLGFEDKPHRFIKQL